LSVTLGPGRTTGGVIPEEKVDEVRGWIENYHKLKELTQPALQRWVGAEHAFSDDALRYSLSGFHLEGLERMLIRAGPGFQAGCGGGLGYGRQSEAESSRTVSIRRPAVRAAARRLRPD
jgi:hypothetical protein